MSSNNIRQILAQCHHFEPQCPGQNYRTTLYPTPIVELISYMPANIWFWLCNGSVLGQIWPITEQEPNAYRARPKLWLAFARNQPTENKLNMCNFAPFKFLFSVTANHTTDNKEAESRKNRVALKSNIGLSVQPPGPDSKVKGQLPLPAELAKLLDPSYDSTERAHKLEKLAAKLKVDPVKLQEQAKLAMRERAGLQDGGGNHDRDVVTPVIDLRMMRRNTAAVGLPVHAAPLDEPDHQKNQLDAGLSEADGGLNRGRQLARKLPDELPEGIEKYADPNANDGLGDNVLHDLRAPDPLAGLVDTTPAEEPAGTSYFHFHKSQSKVIAADEKSPTYINIHVIVTKIIQLCPVGLADHVIYS